MIRFINIKKLFLIDGIGACATSFFLSALLKPYRAYIGMPANVLSFLSLLALIFSVYSMACFFLLKENWAPFLKVISLANVLYCSLTAGLVIYFYQSLTALGIAYFVIEIIIIGILVFVELKALKLPDAPIS